MNPNTKAKLQTFEFEVLRDELLARGASMHVIIAARRTLERKDLAWRAELAEFATKDIAKIFVEQQKVIYGVDDRKDLFQVTNASVTTNANGVVALFRASRVVDNG